MKLVYSMVILHKDASGWQEFFYGKMGEVTKNIRTFALPYETKTYTFAMKYEHDSRKNCASRMKRKKIFFSAAHFSTPLPPSTFYLPPVPWTHTFSAKEKDTETGYSYFGSRYYSSDLSVWLSVDPMSDKYPSLSPYVYCANNPIKLVDPNGEEVYIRGDDVSAALEQLQNQTSLKLSIGKDGKLEYEGTANSKIDALIIQAIDDKNITVNMITGKERDFGNGIVIGYGGGYGGNYYEDGKVCTEQFVCPSNLASLDKLVGDSKTGLTMVHELAESFFGGTIALSQKQSSPDSRYPNSTYLQAHNMANLIAVGDFNHHTLFFKEKPSFMDDETAKTLIPHIEIWERGKK